MISQARVVIIGGGSLGISLLYHLGREGWGDLLLIEKGELTSGSTWHAAGLCSNFIGNMTVAKIHEYSIKLYDEILPAETGEAAAEAEPADKTEAADAGTEAVARTEAGED